MSAHIFRVAGFPFEVTLPAGTNASTLLPSFSEFRSTLASGEQPLFRFSAIMAPQTEGLPLPSAATLSEEIFNDLGFTRIYDTADGGLTVEISPDRNCMPSQMRINSGMTHATAILQPSPLFTSWMLTSMLHILFSQAIIPHDGMLLHASVVKLHGRAALFMGKSGTGKSTHSQLWLKEFPEAELINDDNPALRILPDGQITVYGTPWSGKTPCWRDVQAPVAAMVRLAQAPANRLTPLSDVDAFTAILPGCSVLKRNAMLHDRICTSASTLATSVTVARMECLPDAEAAHICHSAIFGH